MRPDLGTDAIYVLPKSAVWSSDGPDADGQILPLRDRLPGRAGSDSHHSKPERTATHLRAFQVHVRVFT